MSALFWPRIQSVVFAEQIKNVSMQYRKGSLLPHDMIERILSVYQGPRSRCLIDEKLCTKSSDKELVTNKQNNLKKACWHNADGRFTVWDIGDKVKGRQRQASYWWECMRCSQLIQSWRARSHMQEYRQVTIACQDERGEGSFTFSWIATGDRQESRRKRMRCSKRPQAGYCSADSTLVHKGTWGAHFLGCPNHMYTPLLLFEAVTSMTFSKQWL